MRKITEGHICSECLQFNRNKCQATGEVRAAINCACGRFELNEFAHAGETLVLMPEDDGEDVVLTPVEQPHQPADFDMENMQICSRCGQALPLEDFAVIPWSKDGKRFTICRHCRSEAIREAAARRRAAKKERELVEPVSVEAPRVDTSASTVSADEWRDRYEDLKKDYVSLLERFDSQIDIISGLKSELAAQKASGVQSQQEDELISMMRKEGWTGTVQKVVTITL